MILPNPALPGYMRSLGLEELKFNDEASNLLAALADALSQLLSAAREGKKEVQLGPYQVRCTRKPKVFFFVLPASLPKSLVLELRPIAVAEPPKARIVQVLLELEGFDAQASEKLATGLLARADDIVNNGAVGQKYTSCGLQRLRVAIAAAGEALRREEGMSGVVLAAAAALVPGEGSSHRRSWLGPSGNPVLAEQSKLLSELAVAEEDVSGQHAEDAWQADTDQFVQRVEAFCTTSGLSPGKKTQLKHREVLHVALAALEVFQHINKGHATVLLGPACCGKSVVLKAVQAAGHCPGTIETSKPQLCLWYLYPQALADDQGEGCGFDQMLPCLLETITQRHANTHAELATEQEGEPLRQSRVQDLIVFDGEMDETWMEQVWPLVQKRQMLTSGRSMALPSSAELIFETRRLDRASPSFCASCALCPLEDTVGIKELLEAFGERIAKGFAGRAARLHSRILLAWLSRLASNIQEDLRGVDESMNEMVTAQQLLHLLEVTWRTVLPMDLEANDDGEELWESEITLLEVWSIYCAAWVLGGPLDTSLRRRLGSWLLQKSEGANGLPHGLAALQQVREDPENLWKFRIVSNAAALTGLREVTGSTTVKLLWEVLPDPQELDAHHLYVPNEESEAIRLLVRHQVRVECGLGFRLFGPSSGKSALGEHLVLSRTHTSRCTFELLRCPHQISAAGFAGFVQEKMPRKGSRTLSSLPVKTCIVVDDVHLGSLGMREQLRQVLDRGHVTAAPSQEGGAWRAPGLWLGAIDRDAGNTGERWLRHALALRHPDLSERSLIEVCTRFVLRWSVQVPSEEARLMLISQSFPDRVVQVVLEASSSFHRSSPFAARSPLLDLKRWFHSVAHGGAKSMTSPGTLQRMVWHEGMRQLGDCLPSLEDRGKLRQILEDAGLLLSEHAEDPCFLDNGEYLDLKDPASAQSALRRMLAGVLNTFGMPLVFFQEMALAVLSTTRAIQCAMPSEPAGALLLGWPHSGRKTCAQVAIQLAHATARCAHAEEVHRLRDDIQQFRATKSGMGLQCLGLIAQELLMADGSAVLEDIDDLVRGATPIQVPKRLQSSEGVDAVAEHPGTRLRGEERPEKFGGATRLAFLLCVSPTSKPEWFRSQVEKFPSLGSKISPVWIQPWSEDALVEVAQTSLMWEISEGTHTTQDIAESMEVVAAQMAASVSGAGHALSGSGDAEDSAWIAEQNTRRVRRRWRDDTEPQPSF
ncbi:unnamed protein product [Durusdinium trenchii]|uniref:Uncharacterized protein n=1 Tax=Durusdinium trenchii TaxID=1381693 RepID=A0ABP0L671_9DINO